VSQAASRGITPRELAVLALLSNGLTAGGIGRSLTISVHTVNRHLENICRKLGTRDRLATVLIARETGLLPGGTTSAAPATRRLVLYRGEQPL
jgi:DNA-binding NarL/FixJ family response regulator